MEKNFHDRLVQMVVFEISGKEYGIPVHASKEVIRLTEIVEIPNTPPFIAGVINLRGNIICVIDLRKQFRFNARNTDDTRIIIVRIQKMVVGLIVDKVHEVIKVSKSHIDPVPPILSFQIPHNCLVGIAKVDDRIITLLNLENILSSEQLKELTEKQP